MTIEEALATVDELIQPNRLNIVQEMIFRECWLGKTYQEIAENSNYDTNYLRGVGSRLWQFLSEICQEKVTKNNIHSILRQKTKGQVRKYANSTLELPKGSVPIDSYFYIERFPVEEDCYDEIMRPGAFLQIKAPKNMGKTSLLNRLLVKANKNLQYHVVKLNLQQVDNRILGDFPRLLRWLAANICSQLAIKNRINDYWQEDLGAKVSFSIYLRDYILGETEQPLILAIDKLQLLFDSTEVAQEFLPLLRFWHEEAKNSLVWQKLRLVVTQSIDSYVPLSYGEAPCNVGLLVKLPEFDRQQIFDLAQKHELNHEKSLSDRDIQDLRALIGGHPYLTRLAFYHLAKYDLTLPQLVEEAAMETSIYINTLRYSLSILQDNPILGEAFKQVIASDSPVQLESIMSAKLESLGLISLVKNEAIPSCQLYRLYFQDRIEQF